MGAFCCDKPTIIDGMVYFAFQKTADGNGESYGSEVFFMRSKDLLKLHTEDNPQEATWETLPHGDKGLQTDRGLLLGEEPHVLQLSGPKLLCFWRTELGFLDSRYSFDYGETWKDLGRPQPLQYNAIAKPEPNDIDVIYEKKGTTIIQKVEGAVERNEDLIEDSAKYLKTQEYLDLVWKNQSVVRNPRGAVRLIPLRLEKIGNIFFFLFFSDYSS